MTAVRVAPFALFVLVVGCSQQPTAAPGPPDLSQVQLAPDAPAAPAAPGAPHPPAPPAPPPEFAFAPDLGGRAVARAVAPNLSKPLAVERAPNVPKARAVPERVLNPEAGDRARFVPPPPALPPLSGARPAPPAERVPLDLGARADAPPAKPVLPVAAVATPRARNARLLPPAPVLGRQYAERASLADPTEEAGNAAATANTVAVALGVAGFVKVSVPDPFELADQVRPRVPAAADPSALPVPVNPARPR